jgi:hypothetical protein
MKFKYNIFNKDIFHIFMNFFLYYFYFLRLILPMGLYKIDLSISYLKNIFRVLQGHLIFKENCLDLYQFLDYRQFIF